LNRLKDQMFAAETGSSKDELLRRYHDLKLVFKSFTNPESVSEVRIPIGLQIATAQVDLPIYLFWEEQSGGTPHLIEIAEFEENKLPMWKPFLRTKLNRTTIRGLKPGKTYWFRISSVTAS